MKKYLKSIALMLVLIMTLSACNYVSPYGDGTVTTGKTSKRGNTTSTSAETTTGAQITSEETTAEETTKNEPGIDLLITFEKELPKPIMEYTIEDFPEIEEAISYYTEDTIVDGYFNIRIPNDTSEEELEVILKKLEARDDVKRAIVIPKSSWCDMQYPATWDWYYRYVGQWGLSAINIEPAWDITTGSSSIKVGIVDSGIDYTHEDLQGKVHVGLSRSFVTTGTACGATAINPPVIN